MLILFKYFINSFKELKLVYYGDIFIFVFIVGIFKIMNL